MLLIRRSVVVLLAILPVLAPPGAEAATILLNDGGVHTISGPSGSVAVTNGTTLNIQDGAVISTEINSTPIFIDPTSRVTITGLTTTGLALPFGPGGTALYSQGVATISGGTFQGGVGRPGSPGAELYGSATISGGTFRGGDGENGGAGAEIWGSATISGGTFQGGVGLHSGAVGVLIGGSATITGGTFLGVPGGIADGPSLEITDPATLVQVRGGRFEGAISFNNSEAEADFFGTLTFTGGRLTGVLADGTPIDQPVIMEPLDDPNATVVSSPGEVRFLLSPATVPAPTSLVLLGTGLLGTLGAGWIRRGRARAAGGC